MEPAFTGFVEELKGRVFVVRVGRGCKRRPNPYANAVVLHVKPGARRGEFVALNTTPLSLTAAAAIRKVLRKRNLDFFWVR